MKKTVVTGASGFIGRALVEKLVQNRIPVIAVDRNKSDISKEAAFKVLDLVQPSVLDPFVDEDTVLFHMAAQASVPKSVEDPRSDFQSTFCALFEILETARKKGCEVIYPSTASVFDSGNKLPLKETAYIKPTAPYAAAKAAGEAYCAAYNRCYGVKTKIARMFSVYGAGMDRFVIHDLIRKIQKDPLNLTVLGDGNQIRDYLYIEDVIEGLLFIAGKGESGQDYNLASGEPVNILDLAKLIADKMGHKDIQINLTGKSFPGDIPKWYADISKIRTLGFEPKVSLTDGIEKTIDWLLNKDVVGV